MSAKEILYEKIQEMTEEEERHLLDIMPLVKQSASREQLWEQLSKIPGIRVPAGGFKPFPTVTPIAIEGMPASQLLIEDRR